MKINVTENKVSIKEEQILNENEYNIHRIQFDFSSEYTDDLVKVALFSIDNHTYKKIISNNECDIPPEVLTQRGYSILGVYAYKTEQDSLVLRYSPSPTKISVYDGSYKAEAENSEPITPSEIEQYQQILQNSLQQFQNQYNALVEETEGDIQAIEDELQRKVDEGYFDGEDGFSPIAKVIQKSNGATIEIEDKNGKTTADVLNGEDGYTPVRGVDYWTEEDKQEVEEEATQQIEGKIEEYNENAAEKLNQYNQNSVQKTNDYNTNAEQKMSAYNTNATEKTSTYNSNATEKFNYYNSNAEQKETNYNTNASSKLSEYNSNAETKKSAYDENATQKTNSFNTNATNKLTEYNTNHTEKMSAYNSNSTEKLNAFNENATQKTEDFDEHTEEIQDNIEKLQTENARLKEATLFETTGQGQLITLDKTAELEFKKPPLPMGNSEQESTNNLLYLDSVRGGFNDIQPTLENGIVHLKGTNNEEYNTKGSSRNGYVTLNTTEKWKPSTAYYVSFKMEIISNPKALDTSYFSCGLFGEIFDNVQYNTTTGRYKKQINTPSSISDAANNKRYLEIRVDGMEVNISEVSLKTVEDYTFDGYGIKPSPEHESPITNVTGDVEVKVQNKNRIRIDNSAYSNNGIQAVIQDGQITLNGTSTANSIISIPFAYKFNTQEYTISANNPIANTNVIIRFDNNVIPFELNSINKTYTNTFSEEKNVNYLTIRTANGTTLTNFIIKPQLEEGSTATTYTPHKEQVFIFPLGNEKLMLGDYLADDGIHHVRKQVVLDGSEDWTTYMTGNTENYNCFAIRLETSFKKSNNQFLLINAFSNYFKEVAWIYIYNSSLKQDKPAFGFTIDNNKYAYIKVNNAISTAQDLKTWLAQKYANNSPVIIEYPLNEEVIIPYTSAQQEVYNQIKQALSYEEQTNISSNTIALFNVEAYQDAKVILAEKGTYSKPSTGIPKTDLESAVQTSLNKADSAIQEHQDISGKQDITDNTLTTINKTVPTAINEVNSIAKLANQAKSYSTYQAFINYLNTAEKTEFIPGQSFMIQTKLVPDLWVYSVENTSVQYTYTTDEDFITYTNQATGGQVGYYKLAQLETQKVDLTNYVTFDDFATSTTAGVVKTSAQYGVSTSSYTKNLTGATRTYAQYQSGNDVIIICKGTLENVITGKNLESANNKTTTISSSSTDNEYPSAKAVYDYIQSILNNGSN